MATHREAISRTTSSRRFESCPLRSTTLSFRQRFPCISQKSAPPVAYPIALPSRPALRSACPGAVAPRLWSAPSRLATFCSWKRTQNQVRVGGRGALRAPNAGCISCDVAPAVMSCRKGVGSRHRPTQTAYSLLGAFGERQAAHQRVMVGGAADDQAAPDCDRGRSGSPPPANVEYHLRYVASKAVKRTSVRRLAWTGQHGCSGISGAHSVVPGWRCHCAPQWR
jgi:hypothetical protein